MRIQRSKKTGRRLEVKMAHQLLVCADCVVLVCENINTIKKNMEVLLYTSNVTSLEVIISTNKYVHLKLYIFGPTILHIENLTPTFLHNVFHLLINTPDMFRL